uniref:uncharacterized protein LOC122609060 n=1 Tax=Erigeron canadensis TaxID=72917 RepID=UPI001CB8961C|nr:uncharacterized protein LOC122609060 [Erigeron canadensis]
MSEFSVKGVRSMIDKALLPYSLIATRWNKLIPRKVNILAWRILLDRLPTRCNLAKKDVDIPSVLCPLCSGSAETRDHLFGACEIASNIWHSISKWLQISSFSSFGPTDIIEFVDNMQLSWEIPK